MGRGGLDRTELRSQTYSSLKSFCLLYYEREDKVVETTAQDKDAAEEKAVLLRQVKNKGSLCTDTQPP